MEGNADNGRSVLESRLAEALTSLACSPGDVTSPHGSGAVARRFAEALGGRPAAWFVRTDSGWIGSCVCPGDEGGAEAWESRLPDDLDAIGCEAIAIRSDGPQSAWMQALVDLGFERGVLVPASVGQQKLGLLALGGGEELLQGSGCSLLALIGSGLAMRMALDRSTFNTTGWEAASSAPPPTSERIAASAPGFVSSEEAMRRIGSLAQLASLGTLAGGLVHEINNPATFIALAGGQIEKAIAQARDKGSVEGLEGALELTKGIEDSTRQIRDMVAAFRLLVGIANRSVVVTVDLERVLAAAVELTRAAHRHDAMFRRDIEPMPPCPGHYLEIGPVVVNVLVNALEAFRESTSPKSVHVEARALDDAVSIRVTDTGRGIPPAVLARVFDPFFTTKDPSNHAGLGLTIARSKLAGLGGSVAIRSEVGKGTTVEILVPLQANHDDAGD